MTLGTNEGALKGSWPPCQIEIKVGPRQKTNQALGLPLDFLIDSPAPACLSLQEKVVFLASHSVVCHDAIERQVWKNGSWLL